MCDGFQEKCRTIKAEARHFFCHKGIRYVWPQGVHRWLPLGIVKKICLSPRLFLIFAVLKIKMKRLLRNIGALFLFVLFTEFWCSTHLFYHSHVVDGQVIVHSHPFEDEGENQHTQQELKLISILSAFLSTLPGAGIPELPLPVYFAESLLSHPYDGYIKTFPVHSNVLRAPPQNLF